MPGLLAALLSPAIIMQLLNALLDHGTDAYKQYVQGQISKDQLLAHWREIMLNTIGDVEKTHSEALAKTFASFMGALAQSRFMQAVWAIVVLVELGVLASQQIGLIETRPSIEWAYVLIGGLCGLGPLVLRHGPGVLPMQSMRNASK
jgi:hypothetical protein